MTTQRRVTLREWLIVSLVIALVGWGIVTGNWWGFVFMPIWVAVTVEGCRRWGWRWWNDA